MSKTLNEAKIAGRAERKRLPTQPRPHWRGIDPDVHLGYRKGKRGGVWVVRWRAGQGYQEKSLGTADDELEEGTLDYGAAVKAARELVAVERRKARVLAEGPLLTVGSAILDYAAVRDSRDSVRKGRTVRSDATSRLRRYVTGMEARGGRKAVSPSMLAAISMHDLSEGDLIAWRASLPSTLKAATKQRLINDVKAALNRAYADNRSRLPSSLPTVIKHGLRSVDDGEADPQAIARENQILSDAQVGRVISVAREIDAESGWEGDLFRLVVVLAATGARYSQVTRLRVGDVQVDASRLIVPASRKGRGGKGGSNPVRVGPDVLEALMPAIAHRAKSDALLERWRHKQIPGSIRWERGERGPWGPSELARPWEAIRTRAALPPGTIPYALRHSSIVRGIRANLPIRLVAAYHDTSVGMVERHYGRHIADGLDDLAARAVVPLIPAHDDRNVVRLSRT